MLFFSKTSADESRSGASQTAGLRTDTFGWTEENKQDDQQRSRVEAAGAKDLNPANEAGKDQQGQRKTSMEVRHPGLQAGSNSCVLFRAQKSLMTALIRFGAQHKQSAAS